MPLRNFPKIYLSLGSTEMAQRWERLPPTKVAQVQILASAPYVDWFCCCFSPLLREVFLRVLRFSSLLKNDISKFDQESGRRRTTLWKCYLQIIIIIIIIIIIKFCHVVRLQFSTWVACCGFTLGFGGMFLKTWRVHKIFLNRTKKMVGW